MMTFVKLSVIALIGLAVSPLVVQAGLVATFTGDVKPVNGLNLFLYQYTIANSLLSDQSVESISLDVSESAKLQTFVVPPGWDLVYSAGGNSIFWQAVDPDYVIAPGQTAVFSFESGLASGLKSYDIFGPDPFDVSGQVFSPTDQLVPEPNMFWLLLALLPILWLFRPRRGSPMPLSNRGL